MGDKRGGVVGGPSSPSPFQEERREERERERERERNRIMATKTVSI